MWKKEEIPGPTPAPRVETPRPERTERSERSERPEPVASPGGRAIIGRSITIRGEVTGDEDLVIQGRVNGSVDLKQHAVTVGPEGEVKANIIGRVVIVEGRVEGNLTGDEQVILRGSAWVEGDVVAPRVMLEDGTHFRGSVDMGEKGVRSATLSPPAKKTVEAIKAVPVPEPDISAIKPRPPSEARVEAKK